MTNSINNGIMPGFSKKCNDPEIIKGAKKLRNIGRIAAFILALVPILLCYTVPKIKSEPVYFISCIAISCIFILSFIIMETIKHFEKRWDGVITQKYTKERTSHDPDGRDAYRSKTIYYYLKVRTDDGKEKKVSVANHLFYEYVNVNDRVRFHPQLNDYIEKYDKSHDEYLFCAACLKKNSSANDRCEYCNAPMLK